MSETEGAQAGASDTTINKNVFHMGEHGGAEARARQTVDLLGPTKATKKAEKIEKVRGDDDSLAVALRGAAEKKRKGELY